MVRHRLSGGEQRGVLVVGVTACTFLNKDDKIVFCHPYRVIRKYSVNEKGQLEYSLEISKGKILVYAFDSTEAANIVTCIDRSSLRLEKVIAQSSSSAPKSPRGGQGRGSAASSSTDHPVPLLDAEGQQAADASSAPVVATKIKISDVSGMRFNVKLRREGMAEQQRVVAVVSHEGLILIDPSIDKGGTMAIACQKFPWETIVRTEVSEKSLTVVTETGSTVMHTPDARSLLAECNVQSSQKLGEQNCTDADKIAIAVASGARFAIMYPDPKEALFGVTQSHDMDGIKTQDFCPRVFDKLRKHFGITDSEYLQDWDPARNPRREELTPGVKGTKWIVPSQSRRFLALELSRAEAASLLKNLEAYYDYLRKHDATTMIMRLIGLHIADGSNYCIYINPAASLPMSISAYDIHAGGRRVAPPAARGRVNSHLLERDFSLDHRTVFATYRTKKKTLLHIAQDAAFLAKLGWSDFTLEVKVAAFDSETQLEAVRAWIQSVESSKLTGVGALLSPLDDEVYVVALTACFGSKGSDPLRYCQSMYNFAKKRVFSSPDPNVADVEWEKYYMNEVQKKSAE